MHISLKPGTITGNTPLNEIGTYNGVKIYLKDEGGNPSGSLKDRIASSLVKAQLEKIGGRNQLGNRRVIDASSGSFATALAWACRTLGISCTVVVNSKISQENLDQLRAYGAEIIKHGDLTAESREKCRELMLANPDMYLDTNQLANTEAPGIYQETLAEEIFRDGSDIQAVVGSMGSGAHLLGVLRYCLANGLTTPVFGAVRTPGDTGSIAGTFNAGDAVTPFIQELRQSSGQFSEIEILREEALQIFQEHAHCGFGLQGGGVIAAARKIIESRNMTSGSVVVVAGDAAWKNYSRLQP